MIVVLIDPRACGTLTSEGDRLMKSLNERMKELLGTQPSEHDWCSTTRMADPWSVLLGGRRRRGDDPGRPEGDAVNAGDDAARPLPDLRRIWQTQDGKDQER